ncbi:MAG: hypothetical protein ACRC20_02020 [Segniliparus sp.]|uniref:hypothetical protein n=1 Tax=Segniliparus sp. TaxID=2804064 RepID=UPI003F3EB97C
MTWTLTSFLAHRKTPSPAIAPTALLDWPPEETERLANGSERAQLSDDPRQER